MFSRLARYWRVFGTGFSFFVFGLAGLVLGFVVFPILRVVIPNEQRRQARSRELLRWAFRCHIAVMSGVGIIRYSFSGLERLERRGLLIMSNHPSLIDAVLLMAFIRNADCVIDAALLGNKYTRGAVRAVGFIPNQPAGLPLVDACLASLDSGANLLFFPEARRTTPGQPMQLTRGAAQVAVRGGRDVTPVIIHCTPPHLTRGAKWWRVPVRRAQYTISVRADIPVQPFIDRFGEPALSARALTDHLHDYFTKELLAHAVA
jgi:1-acyl-sn-glycerol-3-phosphate acyltransferase